MKKIVDSAYELIGETPILNAKKFALKNDVKDVELLVKLEYLNPAGSVKDRIAYAMILDAEKSGKLKSGGTIPLTTPSTPTTAADAISAVFNTVFLCSSDTISLYFSTFLIFILLSFSSI